MIKECIEVLIEGRDLSCNQMREAMEEIMEGKVNSARAGAFLTLLRARGETVNEITSAAAVMRDKAEKIEVEEELTDTCSTGGTGINHFNISTAAAFVAAGCGVKVAKHGNRAVSGRCGSADVLEKLGVEVQISPDKVKKCIKEAGIGFLFAPVFHRAMKNAAGPRRQLGVRTIFNMLGPLTNPAGASSQLLGVYDPSLTVLFARVLLNLGVKRAMVVHGAGGLDEISLAGETFVAQLKEGEISQYTVNAQDFGLKERSLDEIAGSDAQGNARDLKRVLAGEKSGCRDVVLANSSAALVVSGAAGDFKEGVQVSKEAIDSGRAMEKLQMLISISSEK